jgi:hypothetical protein
MILPNLELSPEIASYAGRYLSPNAPFPIMDPTAPMEAPIQYPSILHFLGGKMVELATELPDQAELFTSKGKIHTEWNAARQAARGPNMKITEDDQRTLLLRETEAVQKQILEIRSDPSYEFNSAKWQSLQVDMLQVAIYQRLEKDKRFCAIVSKATEENKYLLYASENKELGGLYNSRTRKVEGVNLYGTILMDMVKMNPSILSECMAKEDVSSKIEATQNQLENLD